MAGTDLGEVVVLDVDATLVTTHSEKENAAATSKRGFGYHPLGVWCHSTQTMLTVKLHAGNAGSNTATNHIDVLATRSPRSRPGDRGPELLGDRVAHRLLHTAGGVPRSMPAGDVRDGGDVVELTGVMDLTARPAKMRVIVCREPPHPGARLSLSEERDERRYQHPTGADGSGVPRSQLHRAHARVEDLVRCAKDSGLGRFPSGSSGSTRPGPNSPRSPRI